MHFHVKKLWSFTYCCQKEIRSLAWREKSAWSFGKFIFKTKNEGAQHLKIAKKVAFKMKVFAFFAPKTYIWKISQASWITVIFGKVKIETFLVISKDCEGGITRYIHAWKMTPSNGPDPRLKTDSPPLEFC